ncbi:MAG: FAD-dependent monooxygenase [Muribaculaceae bacterium]|nr:FAD-dependent monooxygenase [Muribaculaceae bacterium]
MRVLQLRTDPRTAFAPDSLELLKGAVASQLRVSPAEIGYLRVTGRSIDARQRRVMVNVTVCYSLVTDNEEVSPDNALSEAIRLKKVDGDSPRVIVVGAGPAGLFAALTLLEAGICPILLERGKDVDSRRLDTAAIARQGRVNPESNYCFGEGGAGTFSDGKLYTRSKKRGPIDKVLQTFCLYGASETILIDKHPHLGSDRLPEIIKAMRLSIIEHGGEVRFNTRVDEILLDGNRVKGVKAGGSEIYAEAVILATGHSASDVYRWLHAQAVDMETKGIAVGVRLEHPQKLIDRLIYHSKEGRGQWLPPAEYSMLTRVDDRGVYSFCMCPGGVIVPAASDEDHMVVNGMSGSARAGRFANSGMVVEILLEDVPAEYQQYKTLAMLAFRDSIEETFAKNAPEGTQNAAAQRMTDFVDGRDSQTLPPVSYAPGVHCARVDKLLPHSVAYRLQQGFRDFGRKYPGFMTNDAVVIGDETRTSSPVRITRDAETLMSTNTVGLYPCGEGAGYAGGIVSAAIDGIRCAEAAANIIDKPSKTI